MQTTDTKTIYDNQATSWSRTEPVLLSDYSARPFVIDMCEPLQGTQVLDIGCGEGYVGRELLRRGAEHVLGLDISEKMIQEAETIRKTQSLTQAEYRNQDIRNFCVEERERFDLVIAIFLFNYLKVDEMKEVMAKVFDSLKPGGHFVFFCSPSFAALSKK